MTRKFILSLAAIGVLAAASLASGAAFAKGNHNGNHNGHNGHNGHHDHYRHFVRIHDRVYIRPVGYAVRTVTPGPCTCLTKDYTPEGQVVFQDLCTKEMASAPVAGTSDQSAVQGTTNFAGQTYQDYLKAHPQNTTVETQKN